MDGEPQLDQTPQTARTATPGAPPPPRLGIAITTYNRRDTVLNQVAAIKALTGSDYDLVICDDGSTDGTIEALKEQGDCVIGGTNRGIAWNKNRGLYYLMNIARSDIILLLDDDVVPTAGGWEIEWMEAASRLGHVNQGHPIYNSLVVSGNMTSASPGLSPMIGGWCLAFNRLVLAQVGYMDPRFLRYGHEHTELTVRTIKAGFGGIRLLADNKERTLFYVIGGNLAGVSSDSAGTEADIEANTKIWQALGNEPIYRHAWRTDEQMRLFLGEIAAAAPETLNSVIGRNNDFESLESYHMSLAPTPQPSEADARVPADNNISRGKAALQSSVCEWSSHPTPAEDAAGAVNGVQNGIRKFHTALEQNPWWQVDLGGIATIQEIKIYNATDHAAIRFKNFSLSVSIDGASWVEIHRKQDDLPLPENPFIWNGPGTAWARFVRITLLGRNFLHLDQVEVFGTLPK